MDRLKKIIVFVLTILATIMIGVLLFVYINRPLEYSIESGFACYNNKGILNRTEYSFESFINENNQFEIGVDVYNYNQRKVKYELVVLVNYKQQMFEIEGNNKKTQKFEVKENKKKRIQLILSKAVFKYSINDFMVIVRQDIDLYSADNELVSDSNTVCRHYLIKCKKENNSYEKKVKINCQNIDNVDGEAKLKRVNGSNNLQIYASTNEKLKFKLKLKAMDMRINYVLVCLMNGNQAKFNDSLCQKINKTNTNIEINTPQKKGKYEFEILCIPDLLGCKNCEYKDIEIVSANRYTIQVE